MWFSAYVGECTFSGSNAVLTTTMANGRCVWALMRVEIPLAGLLLIRMCPRLAQSSSQVPGSGSVTLFAVEQIAH